MEGTSVIFCRGGRRIRQTVPIGDETPGQGPGKIYECFKNSRKAWAIGCSGRRR